MRLDAHLHYRDDLPQMDIGFLCSVNSSDWDILLAHSRRLNSLGYRLFVGLHPFWAQELSPKRVKLRIEQCLEQIDGIGEIGLDKRRGPELKRQVMIFSAQAEIAMQYDYYVNLHCCRTEKIVFDVLRGFPKVIVHSFSGSQFYLEKFVEIGWFISFGPAILRYEKYDRLIALCPIENMLIESDFPYQMDNISGLRFVLQKISEVKSISITELESYIYGNFRKILSHRTAVG